MSIHFGDFVLDSARRDLRRRDLSIRVSPQALRFLELLLEQRSRVVSKEEIRARLWPGTFVSDASLARVANEVRKALGDDARDPRFIRTVYANGYVFTAEIGDVPQAHRGASCRLVWDNRRFALREGANVLGRALDALVAIESTRVSRRHARITVAGTKATLEDLGSKNGTFLAGRRIEGATELQDGDQIEVGPALLTFQHGLQDLDTTETG